jgi:3-hydroxyisobutyrate dehydrogenase-like beta-hydroxyacid dehydrogenase
MNNEHNTPSTGVIGLGVLGSIFAEHLIAAGHETHTFDIDADKAQSLSAAASVCESARSVADAANIVVLSLPNPGSVRTALGAPDGLLAADLTGKLIIDTSTVDPDTNVDAARLVTDRGGHYIDAPVSGAEPLEGGSDGARAASITFMVGGDEADFQRAQEVFGILGKYWFHLGPVSSGTRVKLISNLCSGIYTLVAAEAFAMGAAAGVTPEQLLQVFRRTDAKSYAMTDYLLPRALSGRLEPGFSVDLQLKDHRLAAQLADELGIGAPFNALAISMYEAVTANGGGRLDVSSIVASACETLTAR